MGCEREKLLGLLLRLRSELVCKQDKSILDIYIRKIEELLAEQANRELWH